MIIHDSAILLEWADFKALQLQRKFTIRYLDKDEFYIVFAHDEGLIYQSTIWKDDHPTIGSVDPYLEEFEATYMPHANPQRPEGSGGEALVQVRPPEARRVELASFNWCDKTTWYEAATPGTHSEILTGALTAALPHSFIIDAIHGKISGEHKLSKYFVVLSIDEVVLVEDVDFTLDYITGLITFLSETTGALNVDYYVAGSSTWTLAPDDGKVLEVLEVEVQFSDDLEMTDSLHFELYAGEYLVGSTIYKTAMDLIVQASGSYPVIPKLGGEGWRGTKSPVHIFRWPYADRGVTRLFSSMGLSIRLRLENDIPFNGSYGIATFYSVTLDEQ